MPAKPPMRPPDAHDLPPGGGLPPKPVPQSTLSPRSVKSEMQGESPRLQVKPPPTPHADRALSLFSGLLASRERWRNLWDDGLRAREYFQRDGKVPDASNDRFSLAAGLQKRIRQGQQRARSIMEQTRTRTSNRPRAINSLMDKGLSGRAIGNPMDMGVSGLNRILAEVISRLVIISMSGVPFFIQFISYAWTTPAYETKARHVAFSSLTQFWLAQSCFIFTSFELRGAHYVLLPCFLISAIFDMVRVHTAFAAGRTGQAAYEIGAGPTGLIISVSGGLLIIGYIIWIFGGCRLCGKSKEALRTRLILIVSAMTISFAVMAARYAYWDARYLRELASNPNTRWLRPMIGQVFLVHTTSLCVLLPSAYCFFVHTTSLCILLLCAYYFLVHTTSLCILLPGAYYFLRCSSSPSCQ